MKPPPPPSPPSRPRSPPTLYIIYTLLISTPFTLVVLSADIDDATVMSNLAKSLTPSPPGWSSSGSSNPCKWSGVKCDSTNRVTSISLIGKSLSGTLPPSLNHLTNLVTLSLQRNSLSGPLPSLSGLSSLQEVYLDGNDFSSIPSTFFVGLTSLQTFSISENPNLAPWTIPNELNDSASLVSFMASEANVVGSMPDVLGSFPNLQSVRLSYNNLTGSLPSTMAGLAIQNLWLNNQVTGLSGRIDVLGEMTDLSQAWLHSNAFSGPIPDLSKCTSLFDLQLRDNQLTGTVPPSLLSSMPKLANVSLQNNKLQGPFPQFGNGVKATVGLDNNFCNPTPGPCDPRVTTLLEVAGALGYPMTLAESWTGNDPCDAWSFISCDAEKKSVSVINFGKQRFSGTISPAIGNLTSLKSLILNDNSLTGSIPDSLTKLPQLQLVDVTNNNLSGKIPVFPSSVTLKSSGNPRLGSDDDDSDGTSLGGGSSSILASSTLNAIVIAVIVVACLVVVAIGLFFVYKFYVKRRGLKFGSSGLSSKRNGTMGKKSSYGEFGSELVQASQSSTPNEHISGYDGGNVAIPIEILREVTNNFSDKNIIGRGGFGIVYKGELHDGTEIAVKRMEASVVSSKGMNEFQAEIGVLTKVRHRHLVALLGFCVNGNERLLVYEYMPQGTLGQHLFAGGDEDQQLSPLSWKQRVAIALDVARGIEYLHGLAQQSFIHRDLKPSNILLGDDMRAKVSDFGLVKSAPDGSFSLETRLAGTFGYLAPEYAATGRVTVKIDVFAFGVVLMEIITGRKSLDETVPEEQSNLAAWFRRVMTNKSNIRTLIDPYLDPVDEETFQSVCKVAELAGYCTARDPVQRPDMGHVVNALSSLVDHWKPSTKDEDDSFGLDLHMSLPQALKKWQDNSSLMTSSMFDDYSHQSRP